MLTSAFGAAAPAVPPPLPAAVLAGEPPIPAVAGAPPTAAVAGEPAPPLPAAGGAFVVLLGAACVVVDITGLSVVLGAPAPPLAAGTQEVPPPHPRPSAAKKNQRFPDSRRILTMRATPWWHRGAA